MKTTSEWSDAIVQAGEALYQLRGRAAKEQYEQEIKELEELANEAPEPSATQAVAVCRYLLEERKMLDDGVRNDSKLQDLVRSYERSQMRAETRFVQTPSMKDYVARQAAEAADTGEV